MLSIDEYVRAMSVEEAFSLLQNPDTEIIGGMHWLKMQNRTLKMVIDLGDLGLDMIEENDDGFLIGAYVTLRELEINENLNKMTQGAIKDSISRIVGVQFRNTATIGASVFSRFGFSDIITVLLPLHASVVLHKNGKVPLEDFLDMKRDKDILTHIFIPKQTIKMSFLAQRNTATDFSVLNTAVVIKNHRLLCAVGARPGKAVLYDMPCEYGKEELIAEKIAAETKFSKDMRASEEYRQKLCAILVGRAIKTAQKGGI